MKFLVRFFKRITGASIPFFGLSWQPGIDEQPAVYGYFQIIAGRTILTGGHRGFDKHTGTIIARPVLRLDFNEFNASLKEIRKASTNLLTVLPPESRAREHIEKIRTETQIFCDRVATYSSSQLLKDASLYEEFCTNWNKYFVNAGTELTLLNEMYDLNMHHSRIFENYVWDRRI